MGRGKLNDELIKELQQATYHEYVRAVSKNGYCFSSQHEAYAVIKEEYEEALDQFEWFEVILSNTGA
jgi:DNA-binding winged helix-turn-helix (wHTH) protein